MKLTAAFIQSTNCLQQLISEDQIPEKWMQPEEPVDRLERARKADIPNWPKGNTVGQ